MALPINTPSNVVVVSAYMANSGGASATVYMACPVKGRVIRLASALQGSTVANGDNVFTAGIAKSTDLTTFAAITHDTWTQATSGSTAGDVDVVSAGSANRVSVGDCIRVVSDGGGDDTTPTMIYAVIAAE